jgi:DNA-binding NtrC family response regulator
MHDLSALDGQNSYVRITPPLSILIVDDYEITRSAMAHLIAIKMPNAAVHAIADYTACVGFCSLHQIDIVITDLKRASARVGGIFEKITSADSNIRLILTTGYSAKEEELASVSGLPNLRLLEKPVDFSELIAEIGKIADEKNGKR